MDYFDIVSSYPSLEFLRELYFGIRKKVCTDTESRQLPECSWIKTIAHLKPFLDDWYYPREYWYTQDMVNALEQLINAKVFCMRKCSETDEGLLFISSRALRKKEKDIEKDIYKALQTT